MNSHSYLPMGNECVMPGSACSYFLLYILSHWSTAWMGLRPLRRSKTITASRTVDSFVAIMKQYSCIKLGSDVDSSGSDLHCYASTPRRFVLVISVCVYIG